MLKLIKALTGARRQRQHNAATTAAAPSALANPLPDNRPGLRPPREQGLTLLSVEELLKEEAYEKLMKTLSFDAGHPPAEFERYYVSVIRNYAAYAHLLPASENHHHRYPGGLLRHSLEAGNIALRATRDKSFTRSSGWTRRELTPRWEYATWLAALLHDAGKLITDVRVISPSSGEAWSPLRESITDWGARLGLEQYFVRWNHERKHKAHEKHGLDLFYKVMPQDAIDYLAAAPDEEGKEIWRELTASLTGQPEEERPLAQCVSFADRASISIKRAHIGAPAMPTATRGMHERLLDAMRELAATTWQINTEGARLWYTQEGLHLVCPLGLTETNRHLAEIGDAEGLPSAPEEIAAILMEHGLLVPCQTPERSYTLWRMGLPRVKGIALKVIRFDSVERIFPYGLPVGVKALSATFAPPASKEENMAQPQELAPQPQAQQVSTRAWPAAPAASEIPLHAQPNGQPQQARDWLREHGSAGAMLAAISEDLERGKLHPELVFWWEEGLALQWPAAVAPYVQDSKAMLAALSAKDWLEVDPLHPLRNVRRIETAQGRLSIIVLTTRIGRMVCPSTSGTDRSRPPADQHEQRSLDAALKTNSSSDPEPGSHLTHLLAELADALKRREPALATELLVREGRVALPQSAIVRWYCQHNPSLRFDQVQALLHAYQRENAAGKLHAAGLFFLGGILEEQARVLLHDHH